MEERGGRSGVGGEQQQSVIDQAAGNVSLSRQGRQHVWHKDCRPMLCGRRLRVRQSKVGHNHIRPERCLQSDFKLREHTHMKLTTGAKFLAGMRSEPIFLGVGFLEPFMGWAEAGATPPMTAEPAAAHTKTNTQDTHTHRQTDTDMDTDTTYRN